MGTSPEQTVCELLLADANILIDLNKVGALGLVGNLTKYGIAKISLPRTIYDEISEQITETQILDLGIEILPVTRELTIKILEYPDKRLSSPDRSLLLIAKEKSYGVWTNDRRLRLNCTNHGIEVLWEFELLKKLVYHGCLMRDTLLEVARQVEEINPFLKGVYERLTNEV